MLRSFLRLRPKKGRAHDVVHLFADRSILERASAMPGCLGVDLGLFDEEQSEILVTALWESPASYQGWVNSAGRGDDVAQLLPLLVDGPEAISPTQTCQILLSAAVEPGVEHAI